MKLVQRALLSAPLIFGTASWASSPDFQVADAASLRAVCRVVTNGDGNGTGTVIDKMVATVDPNDPTKATSWYLCVLTAGHVINGVATGNIQAGFENQDRVGPGPNLTPGAIQSAEDPLIAGCTRDLGVFIVKVNADAYFGTKIDGSDGLQPIPIPSVAQGFIDINQGAPFSSVGYGYTGTFFNNGPAGLQNGYFRQDDTYGIKRFMNQTVLAAANIADGWEPEDDGNPYGGGYCGQAVEWQLHGPTTAGRVDGEGVTFAGDSGSPYLFGLPGNPYDFPLHDWVTGDVLQVRTDLLLAVHSGYSGTPGPDGTVKNYKYMDDPNGLGYGASLQEAPVRQWIDQNCALAPTPEPAALVALGIGLASLFWRRRKTVSSR